MSQCAGAGTRSSRRTSNGPWAPCPRPTAWASPAAAEPPLPRSWLSRAASPPGRDGRFSRCPCPWAEPPHRCSPGGDPGAQTTAGDRGRGGIPTGTPCVAAARPCLHPDTGPGGAGHLSLLWPLDHRREWLPTRPGLRWSPGVRKCSRTDHRSHPGGPLPGRPSLVPGRKCARAGPTSFGFLWFTPIRFIQYPID